MRAIDAALDKKALEPVLLDVRKLASYTDYIAVVSGSSDRHVNAISEGIIEEFRKTGTRPLGAEGLAHGRWTLVDFGDIIVHVFFHPVRAFYDLESLWIEAGRVPLEVPDEARVPAGELY